MKKENPTPDFYTGAPLDSEDLMYRDKFIQELWEALESAHVLLMAPRRTGKTSVMDHLKANRNGGFIVIKENVQDLTHPADFFLSLLARFHDEHPKILRDTFRSGWKLITDAFDRLESVGAMEFKVALRESDPEWRTNWRSHGQKLLSSLRSMDTRALLIIDELPDMLLNLRRDHPELLQPFLAWFRSQRLEPNPKQDSIRWLLGGSVNLYSTLDGMGLVDLINDLHNFPLPALTEDEVEAFVSTMLKSRGVPIEPDLPHALTQYLGRPIPIFMQLLTLDIYRHWKKSDSPERALGARDVEEAFDRLVRSSAAQDKLQHYYSRLQKYYQEPNLSAAHSILGQLSLSPNGLSRGTLYSEFQRHLADAGVSLFPHESKKNFNQLLRDLSNDFYIDEIEEDQFDFASGVLKTWWKKYYA